MAKEEDSHRAALIALQERFGETIPLIRREHVAGFYGRRPTCLADNLSLDQMRSEAAEMEKRAERFCLSAAAEQKTRIRVNFSVIWRRERHHRHATDLEERVRQEGEEEEETANRHSS